MIIALAFLVVVHILTTESFLMRPLDKPKLFILAATKRGTASDIFSLNRIREAGFIGSYFASVERDTYDHPTRRRPEYDSPIIVVPEFLSVAECDEIIEVAKDLERKGVVADLYLNHRVNKDIKSGNMSSEAMQLIREQHLTDEELAANSPSGFRALLPPSVLLGGQSLPVDISRGHPITPPANSIGQRVLKLLGCDEQRKLAFLEDMWINPNSERVMVRDQTTVHYRPGEGVPPHVDGNDVTILTYLNDMPRGAGGRTIFVEAGIASVPKRGTALMYCSKGRRLLHFAERVKAEEKWVMQLLIDCNYRKASTANYS